MARVFDRFKSSSGLSKLFAVVIQFKPFFLRTIAGTLAFALHPPSIIKTGIPERLSPALVMITGDGGPKGFLGISLIV